MFTLEAELHLLKQRMWAGRLNKVRCGKFCFALPAGYLRRTDGQVVFDPDEQAQTVIRLIFAKFSELGTLQRRRPRRPAGLPATTGRYSVHPEQTPASSTHAMPMTRYQPGRASSGFALPIAQPERLAELLTSRFRMANPVPSTSHCEL